MIDQKSSKNIDTGSEEIRKCILKSLRENTGALIGRHGSTELTCILSQDPKKHCDRLETYSGIFGDHMSWLPEYIKACAAADIFAAGWFEPLAEAELAYINLLNPSAKLIPLRSLEPYYSQVPWTQALSGEHVCVVSSFAISMKTQDLKCIWEREILPDCTWSFVRSYYPHSIGGPKCTWPRGIDSSLQAIDYLESEVLKSGSKIVLIGCGGLAMPLAHRLKQKGLVAIVLGGAIQILFGIKGFRWENHSVISKFFNDSWVFPSADEVPLGAEKIEHGCYW